MVNSTGVDVDLSESTGKAIAEVAGPEFRKACEQLRPLCPEWVKDTDAYDFKPCEKILHCNSPFYKNDFEYMVRVKSLGSSRFVCSQLLETCSYHKNTKITSFVF